MHRVGIVGLGGISRFQPRRLPELQGFVLPLIVYTTHAVKHSAQRIQSGMDVR